MIRVQDLVKTFGDFRAVDNISFAVKPAEIFAFLGPNGAGETTTIKMLSKLLKPAGGSITLPIIDSELTANENMDIHGVLYGVPSRLRAERTETLPKLFELWDRRDGFVRTFSGGMKRRLEIARGFLHTPNILFLDEPTLGLLPAARQTFELYRYFSRPAIWTRPSASPNASPSSTMARSSRKARPPS